MARSLPRQIATRPSCVVALARFALAAHLGGYIWLLMTIEEWRPIWFLPISLAEFPIVLHVLDIKTGRYDSLRSRDKRSRYGV
jgi:hypothetical protein